MAVKAIGITTLVNIVKDNPNDTDLGKALRKYLKDNFGI